MLGFNYVTGLSGCAFRIASSSIYFGDYYTNIKNIYLPEENRIECKKPNKNEILGNLIFYIISLLYSYFNDYEFFAFFAYFYDSILYLLYLNMYLFSTGNKNFMLLNSLIIFGISYFIFKYFNVYLICFLLLLICFLIIFDNLISYKHVFQDEISALDINSIFFDLMVSMCFFFYSCFLGLICFFLCNFCIFITCIIGFTAYLYGENKINKNSQFVIFLKTILLVHEDNKQEKFLELIESNLENEYHINSNNINNSNNTS